MIKFKPRGKAWLAPSAVLITAALGLAVPAQAQTTRPHVLLVCNGSTVPCPAIPRAAGPYYRSVQAAVDAAHPGDWILIYPGVYHEKSKEWPTAGVWIDQPDLHIRGLDRDRVIIDGSNGTAAHPCPSAAAEQDFTPRDGIVVFKASGVTIQNLTVCDYLSGPSGHGNEIWWDGGDGSGTIGLGSFSGSYLTATSEYAPANLDGQNLSQYGIFAGNASGPAARTTRSPATSSRIRAPGAYSAATTLTRSSRRRPRTARAASRTTPHLESACSGQSGIRSTGTSSAMTGSSAIRRTPTWPPRPCRPTHRGTASTATLTSAAPSPPRLRTSRPRAWTAGPAVGRALATTWRCTTSSSAQPGSHPARCRPRTRATRSRPAS
jgi:hypothetical protein